MKSTQISLRHIFKLWGPLGLSWLFTGIETPALSAVIARLPNPEINLAAYGGIIFPLSLIIEAPIIMLLAASTALCQDWASYVKIRRFMVVSAVLLTGLHILIAFTPLYYVVIEDIIGAPQEIVEPARAGLMLMTPWTGMIAYRRFQQGVLIRYGQSDAIGISSLLRIIADGIMLVIGALSGGMSGVMVGAAAQAVGVTVDAVYNGIRVQPILRGQLKSAPPVAPLTWRAFASFYTPLALTSFLSFLWGSVASATISRMYMALESLAVQQVLNGLSFLMRTPGVAYEEVVVALIDKEKSFANLKRFTKQLSAGITVFQLLLLVTPLALFWFHTMSGLSLPLAKMGLIGFWLVLPLPAMTVYQSWYQGIILFGRKTRGIPESIIVFLLTAIATLASGFILKNIPGLYVGMGALTIASLAQTGWLRFRSQPAMKVIKTRDEAE